MDEPLAVVLKFGFLAVLYLFLLWVARSALRDLAQHEEAGVASEGTVVVPRRERRQGASADMRAAVSPRLAVVAAMGLEPGTELDISEGATLGRSESADIRVDDPFASSVHARIFPRGDFMFVEDVGSTNGTFLNGRQVRRAEQLKPADTIRIGDSEYRYQE
jgi:FHA domain-containing protein